MKIGKEMILFILKENDFFFFFNKPIHKPETKQNSKNLKRGREGEVDLFHYKWG
jgi:hypothetical protein